MDITEMLSCGNPDYLATLIDRTEKLRLDTLGNQVYMRGLIEFSNICRCDCFYCGLRKSHTSIRRYHLKRDQILHLAEMARSIGIYSLAMQSGEIASQAEVDFVAEVVRSVHEESNRDGSPDMGITLSIGELSYAQYQQLYEAGAHRYLLRVESSNPDLFRSIHPVSQSLERRLECLNALKEIGYQVGTGVMIGLPGQTWEHLAADLNFFVERDIDMLGMGPYIPHPRTPLARSTAGVLIDPYTTTLKMLALARLMMPDINMVVSTALQTIHPEGLKMGVKAGGNVVMPIFTPVDYRMDYSLYAGTQSKNLDALHQEIESAGYQLAFNTWGDPQHYYRRRNLPYSDHHHPDVRAG